MKARNIKWIVLSTAAVLTTAPVWADDTTGTKESKESAHSQTPAATQNAVLLSKLMDAKATLQSGESLGTIEDLLINPNNGKIDFVVLGRGGFLGIGEKRVPVPWQAVSFQSEKQFTVNVDKKKIESGPTLSKDYSDLSNPEYSMTIYRHYDIPMGASEGLGGSQQGRDSDTKGWKHSDQKDNYKNK